jgi:hypothetical protein
MTVRTAGDGTIVLEGRCPVDDAEDLLRLLLLDPSSAVDWRTCDDAHTAVIQVLLAARPKVLGPPRAMLLSKWIEPIICVPNA